MAVQNYKFEARKKSDQWVDFTASDPNSTEKILLRLIESKQAATVVGVDAVRKILETMQKRQFDKVILVGRQFTDAAQEEMVEKKIQRISEDYMPPVLPERLYLTINEYVDKLCKATCGKAPQEEAECSGFSRGAKCEIRTISDNAAFHFERGWAPLLRNDLRQLVSMQQQTKIPQFRGGS
jgi:hypothetical protein